MARFVQGTSSFTHNSYLHVAFLVWIQGWESWIYFIGYRESMKKKKIKFDNPWNSFFFWSFKVREILLSFTTFKGLGWIKKETEKCRKSCEAWRDLHLSEREQKSSEDDHKSIMNVCSLTSLTWTFTFLVFMHLNLFCIYFNTANPSLFRIRYFEFSSCLVRDPEKGDSSVDKGASPIAWGSRSHMHVGFSDSKVTSSR